jgi:ring-1,2-phenylacetyl-CoA epoxidase subunit PaaE
MATAMPAERRAASGSSMVTVQVLACVPAARDAVTFLLAQPGTQRAPAPYLPGQFITLSFSTGERTLYRSYSLCGDGRADAPWEITVKRRDAGLISTYLCQRVQPGMVIRSSMPQGGFTLPATIRPDVPLVFVAGGSGITPIYGLLRALARLDAARRPQVQLHYAYGTPEDAIYGRELAALDPQGRWLTQHHYVSTRGERLHAHQVMARLGAQAQRAEWYICGPDGLKRAIETEAQRRGVPASHVHREVFASPRLRTAAPAAPAGACIRLAESGAVLSARPGETVLETLERHGYQPDFSCRAGACGTCRMRLLAGRVRNGDGEGLSPSERASGYVLSCCAEPVGEIALSAAGLGSPSRAVGGAPRAGARTPARRQTAKRLLRGAMVAAALGLFFNVWGLTSHATATTPSTTSSGSTATSSSTSSGTTNNSGGFSGSSSGSSGITTQPSQSVPSTSTGVS